VTDDDVGALVDDPYLRRDVSAVALAEAMLERVERLQPRLHAMITITAPLALADARRVDERRACGTPLPLDGLPVVIKDNVDVEGIPTTVGSRLFAGCVAADDAEVTRRLRAAGAVILGKANMHELAFGATSLNEAFGHVVNPAAPARIPGGSSGGSGAAVAADLCVAAIGTDTGGSIRLPASLCGVSGLRPTYGAVSNRGVRPVSRSLDTVGPLARSVVDLRAVLEAMAGFDAGDPYSVDGRLDLADAAERREWRVGVVEDLLGRSDPSVASLVREAAGVLVDLGASLVPVELPGADAIVEACGHLIKAEALAVYCQALASSADQLEEGTRRRLALAADLTASDLALIQHALVGWAQTMRAVFDEVDLLLLPTIPVEAPFVDGADTVATTAAVVSYTHLLSFARIPSLSIPCGITPRGAPVGAMLAAAWWRDGLVLRAGAAIQSVTDWHRRRAFVSA
jgi:aspartyl-tRNA(Asn)/glutamyl-tRNA(Gln) amidotransferase subunit A